MLRRLRWAAIAAIVLCGPARADFYDGIRAYDRADYAAAQAEWLPLAQAGDAAAQANLGVLYWRGQGVAEDHAAAARWFRLAADQGNAIAQDNLGQMYYLGQGVEQSDEEAAHWIKAAAFQGDSNAQLRLGSLYAEGIGVAKDEERAVIWWRKAAKQGNSEAQVRLGLAYERGFGVAKDAEKARRWFDRASEAFDPRPLEVVSRSGPPPAEPVAPSEPEEPAAPAAAVASAPPPAAPEPSPPETAPEGVLVQIASLTSPDDARSEWERLRKRHPDLLGDLELHVQRADLGSRGVFYRVQVGPLRDRERAERLCQRLRNRRLGCLVAEPSEPGSVRSGP